jgi:hypothetical protein
MLYCANHYLVGEPLSIVQTMDPHCIFFMNESQQFIYCLLRFIATFDFLRTDLIAKNLPWSRLMGSSKKLSPKLGETNKELCVF